MKEVAAAEVDMPLPSFCPGQIGHIRQFRRELVLEQIQQK
jgi:hypothetical protein